MTRIIWINIFITLIIISVLTSIRIIALQKDYTPPQKNTISYSERGPIFDRNGNILAMQINSWHVGLRLIDTSNPNEVINILSTSLHIPKDEIEKKLAIPSKYVRIKKFISKEEYDTLMKYKKQGKLYGVQIHEVPWRKYPGNDSIAQVIGYYGEEGNGLDGIEQAYNEYLEATKNGLGNSVYLTIDSVLQKNVEQIVKETLEESKSSYITTILMDAKTGDILAYVEEPSFNLNHYYTYDQEKLANNIISKVYEPGSVFKIFSMASVLDSGVITESTLYDASKPYVDPLYNFTIQDISYPGIINTSEIIKYSSNVGVSLATFNMDKYLLYKYLVGFGFGKKTGVQLPGESSGILNNPSEWSARSKPTIALGQEIGVTAIQIVSAATAFANQGVVLSPNLIQKITSPTGEILYEKKVTPLAQVIKKDTAESILKMMHSATEGGTARRLKIEGIHISAKTGTAQVFDIKEKKYSETDFIASTLSLVPSEEPELIIYSVIHTPTSGEIYGGRTTAPMIKKMLEFILPHNGLVGNTYQVDKVDDTIPNSKIPEQQTIDNYYGNYLGLSKREVWSIFVNSKIKINMHGNGNVVSQKPEAYTPIGATDYTLELYFE